MLPKFLFEYKYVILSALIGCIFILLLSTFNKLSLPSFSSYPSFEKVKEYEKEKGISLSNNFKGSYCDILISGPDREIRHYSSESCSSLKEKYITKEELLSFFNNSRGSYSILVYSDKNESFLISFEIR